MQKFDENFMLRQLRAGPFSFVEQELIAWQYKYCACGYELSYFTIITLSFHL